MNITHEELFWENEIINTHMVSYWANYQRWHQKMWCSIYLFQPAFPSSFVPLISKQSLSPEQTRILHPSPRSLSLPNPWKPFEEIQRHSRLKMYFSFEVPAQCFSYFFTECRVLFWQRGRSWPRTAREREVAGLLSPNSPNEERLSNGIASL